ncbi:nucleotide pyrophosphatase, partial [Streptomyces sp. SID8455]|nr:nucleotide pyrophosphatase [Streptomyces sp. SID8455]
VLASWNGATPTAVKSYTSDVISQPQSLKLSVPPGATSVSFRFHYTGANNWYWVIDGVKITTG